MSIIKQKNNQTLRIHIFGASGSGTTTLGRKLSKELNIKAFDLDDYYWEKTDPPFQVTRERTRRFKLLESDLENLESFIISGHYGLEYEPIDSLLTLAIFLYVPAKIRQSRLKARELLEYGDRILEGGDMHEDHLDFVEWAGHYDANDLEGRKLEIHLERIELLSCPVLNIKGDRNIKSIVRIVYDAIGIK